MLGDTLSFGNKDIAVLTDVSDLDCVHVTDTRDTLDCEDKVPTLQAPAKDVEDVLAISD